IGLPLADPEIERAVLLRRAHVRRRRRRLRTGRRGDKKGKGRENKAHHELQLETTDADLAQGLHRPGRNAPVRQVLLRTKLLPSVSLNVANVPQGCFVGGAMNSTPAAFSFP